ncbi:MAG: formylglycine-generating enzyme family protein, partial [Prevotellaceae bacterium]|nr:formylglycine-generating enzyme family protein [Prevotellaceae bacterium]
MHYFKRKEVRAILAVLAAIIVGSAAKDLGGELTGVQGRPIIMQELPPYGMVLIPQGSFNMGLNDEDALFAMNAPAKVVSVDAFWIDQTEITNNEYRQFVTYVIDSITRRMLGEQFDEFLIMEDANGNPLEPALLNWGVKYSSKNADYLDIINMLYTPVAESATGGKTLKVKKLLYAYSWVNYHKVLGWTPNATDEPLPVDENGDIIASSYIERESIPVYPDTLVWIRDFNLAYNEPLTLRYFAHPSYDDYPVVGINWKQATAFCHWRTNTLISYFNRIRRPVPHSYRLPTEAEWEFAARGGLLGQKYPWGGLYTYNIAGCYLANFLPQRGRYGLDGGVKTLPVGSFEPNDFGLFDMAGNVSEWTNATYEEKTSQQVHDLNPSFQFNAQEG